MILLRYANEPVDVDKVIRMLLIHDLIEIEAGDTFAMIVRTLLAQQEQVESDAAQVVFGKMRVPFGEEMRALWDEFEARVTPESKFAKAIDRFMPIYQQYP
jgi:putative hydrolases of HD superfamily